MQARRSTQIVTGTDSGHEQSPAYEGGTLDELVWESIREVLIELLGRRATEAIYGYLEKNSSINRDETPKNTRELFAILDETFGKGGKVIGIRVVRRVFEKLNWKFQEVQGFEFSDYFEVARARLARELVEKAKATMKSEELPP